MAKETILIIEDEKNIVELIKYNLEKEGYRVMTAYDGEDGLSRIRKQMPSLILLDLMLPGIDGLEICKTVRQNPKTAAVPVMMLTARSEEIDKVIGLELGADDYMTKPFSPRELLARVKALLRRACPTPPSGILTAGRLQVDTEKYIVTIKDKPVELTSKEFNLLRVLMEAGGRVLSRELLLEQVWGLDRAMNIETRTVDMHIGQLRKKLKPEAARILTVKNVGYRFDTDG